MPHAKSFDDRYIPEPNSGCWIWLGASTTDHYGKVGVNGKTLRAHRYSYELHKGPIPEGLGVLHKCDNTFCVNPDHLFLGTHDENMKDKKRKGRAAVTWEALRGSNRPNAILNEEQALAIFQSTTSYKVLADLFGVSLSAIGHIKSGKTWNHVTNKRQMEG